MLSPDVVRSAQTSFCFCPRYMRRLLRLKQIPRTSASCPAGCVRVCNVKQAVPAHAFFPAAISRALPRARSAFPNAFSASLNVSKNAASLSVAANGSSKRRSFRGIFLPEFQLRIEHRHTSFLRASGMRFSEPISAHVIGTGRLSQVAPPRKYDPRSNQIFSTAPRTFRPASFCPHQDCLDRAAHALPSRNSASSVRPSAVKSSPALLYCSIASSPLILPLLVDEENA